MIEEALRGRWPGNRDLRPAAEAATRVGGRRGRGQPVAEEGAARRVAEEALPAVAGNRHVRLVAEAVLRGRWPSIAAASRSPGNRDARPVAEHRRGQPVAGNCEARPRNDGRRVSR